MDCNLHIRSTRKPTVLDKRYKNSIPKKSTKNGSWEKGEGKNTEDIEQEGIISKDKIENNEKTQKNRKGAHFERIYNDSWYDISAIKQEDDVYLFCRDGDSNDAVSGKSKKDNKADVKKKSSVLKTIDNTRNLHYDEKNIIKGLEEMYLDKSCKKYNNMYNIQPLHELLSFNQKEKKFSSFGRSYNKCKKNNVKNGLINYIKGTEKKEVDLSLYKNDLGKIKENLNDIKNRNQKNKEIINYLIKHKNIDSAKLFKELGFLNNNTSDLFKHPFKYDYKNICLNKKPLENDENYNVNSEEDVKNSEERNEFLNNLLQNGECELLKKCVGQTVENEKNLFNQIHYDSLYTNKKDEYGNILKECTENLVCDEAVNTTAENEKTSLKKEIRSVQTYENKDMNRKKYGDFENVEVPLPIPSFPHSVDEVRQNNTNGYNRTGASQLENYINNNNQDSRCNIMYNASINNTDNLNEQKYFSKLYNKDNDMMFTIDLNFYKPMLIKNVTQIQIYDAYNKLLKNVFIDTYPQKCSLILLQKCKANSDCSFLKIKNKIIHTRDTQMLKFVLLNKGREIGFSIISVKNLLCLGQDSGLFISVYDTKTECNRLDKIYQLGETKRRKWEHRTKENTHKDTKEKGQNASVVVNTSDIFPFNQQDINIFSPKIFIHYKLNCPKFLFDTMPAHDIIKTKDKILCLEHVIRDFYFFFENSSMFNNSKNMQIKNLINEKMRKNKKTENCDSMNKNVDKEEQNNEIKESKKNFLNKTSLSKKEFKEKQDHAIQHEKQDGITEEIDIEVEGDLKKEAQHETQAKTQTETQVDTQKETQRLNNLHSTNEFKKMELNIQCDMSDQKGILENGEEKEVIEEKEEKGKEGEEEKKEEEEEEEEVENKEEKVENKEEEKEVETEEETEMNKSLKCPQLDTDVDEEKLKNARSSEWKETEEHFFTSVNFPQLKKSASVGYELKKTIDELNKIIKDYQVEMQKKDKQIEKLKHAYNNLNILYKLKKKVVDNNFNETLNGDTILTNKFESKKKLSQQSLEQQKKEKNSKVSKTINNNKSFICRWGTRKADANNMKAIERSNVKNHFRMELKRNNLSKSIEDKNSCNLKTLTSTDEQEKYKAHSAILKKLNAQISDGFSKFYKVRRRDVKKKIATRKNRNQRNEVNTCNNTKEGEKKNIKETIPLNELENLQNGINILKTEINELKKNDDIYLSAIASLRKVNIPHENEENKINIETDEIKIEKLHESLKTYNDITTVPSETMRTNINRKEVTNLGTKNRFDFPCDLVEETWSDNSNNKE